MSAEHRPYFESLLERMSPLGHVTGKAMFGGFGFWEDGDMFALLDSGGTFRLKADDTTVPNFERAGSEPFSPEMRSERPPITMPYWTVPAKVLRSDANFETWVRDAIAVGHATAKRKGRTSTSATATKRAVTKKAVTKKATVTNKVAPKRSPTKI